MATTPCAGDPVEALQRRVRSLGAQPLLTCYDIDDGSRVEFSAQTFANWVDKTANLVGSLGLDEGDRIGMPLLLDHPGHWVGLVWVLAAWQAGCSVVACPRDDLDDVDLAVLGPLNPHPVPSVETVVCSLHPLGAALGSTHAGITDYAQVLGEPDLHWRTTLPDVLLTGATGTLAAASLGEVAPVGGRLLLQPAGDPWPDVRDLVVGPLLGGGSTVVVRGDAALERLATIATDEHAMLP